MKASTLFIRILCIFVILFWMNNPLHARSFSFQPVIYTGKNNGMFSIFMNTVAGIANFERGNILGFEVNLGYNGLYYDPSMGPNWWNYYCEPLCLGIFSYDTARRVDTLAKGFQITVWNVEIEFSRQEVNRIIQTYIRYKPHIKQKLNDYISQNFNGYFVIGVHYRGTDKIKEAKILPYGEVVESVQMEFEKYANRKVKIFVATDESDFLDAMKDAFPGYVCCLEEAIRSQNGAAVHYNNDSPYQQGEEALLDSLILSNTNLLIRTSSNLSLWSTYVNPSLKVIELTKRR